MNKMTTIDVNVSKSKPVPEYIWRQAEHSLARRERLRLIRIGHIKPDTGQHTPLVKGPDGCWTTVIYHGSP